LPALDSVLGVQSQGETFGLKSGLEVWT
jgi:hypothetical protein